MCYNVCCFCTARAQAGRTSPTARTGCPSLPIRDVKDRSFEGFACSGVKRPHSPTIGSNRTSNQGCKIYSAFFFFLFFFSFEAGGFQRAEMVPFPVYQYVHNSVCKKKLTQSKANSEAGLGGGDDQSGSQISKKRSFDSCCGRACFVADYCSMMGGKKKKHFKHAPYTTVS